MENQNPFMTKTEQRQMLQKAIINASVALMGEDSPSGYSRALEAFNKAQTALETFERQSERQSK